MQRQIIIILSCLLFPFQWSFAQKNRLRSSQKEFIAAKKIIAQEYFPEQPYIRSLPYLSPKEQKKIWQLWHEKFPAPTLPSRKKKRSVIKERLKSLFSLLKKKMKALPPSKRAKFQLALAHLLTSLGFKASARQLYAKLNQQSRPSIKLIANVMLAREHLSKRRYRQTFQKLKRLPRRIPSNLLRLYWEAAYLMKANTSEKLGKKDKALQIYRFLLRKKSLISNEIQWRILKLHFRQKKYLLVIKKGFAFIRHKWRSHPRIALLIAKSLEKIHQTKQALQIYKTLAKKTPLSSSIQGRLLLAQVKLALSQKKKRLARRLLLKLLWSHRGKWYAQRAWQIWRAHHFPSYRIYRYRLALHLYRRGQLAPALKLFGKLSLKFHRTLKKKRKKIHWIASYAQFYKGLIQFRLRKNKKSYKTFSFLLKYRRLKKSLRFKAQFYRMRAYYRWKRDLNAIKKYELFWRHHKKTSRGRQALWWSAQLYFEHGKEKKAIKGFLRYYRLYKKDRRRAEALLKIALAHYKQKRFKKVIAVLRPLLRFRPSIAARARFWMGKSYEKLHKNKVARRIFKKISPKSDPYYAARARVRTHNEPFFSKDKLSLYNLIADQSQEERLLHKVARWYRRFYPKKPSLFSQWKQLRKTSAYRRAFIFALARDFRSVRREFRKLERKNPLNIYFLGRAWLAFGVPHRAILTAYRLPRKFSKKAWSHFPRLAYYRLLFPVAFPYLYEKFKKKYELSSLLMLAITRQESLFNPYIRSGAGAVGIAQIMPKAARHLARLLGLKRFHYSMLLDPNLNLEMGFLHLRNFLRRYHKVELALVAYNAGGHHLKRWQKQYPNLWKKDLEAFLEIGVGFRETRRYVPSCLRWYQLYAYYFHSR